MKENVKIVKINCNCWWILIESFKVSWAYIYIHIEGKQKGDHTKNSKWRG